MTSPPSITAPLTAEDFGAMANVSRETLARLERYAHLLCKWNTAINLVGRDSLPDLWRRHFLDSAQLWALLPPPPSDRPRMLVDLGSGAGFPGLVLAILGAGVVHLIDSDRRKAAFLRETARETGTDITIYDRRIEDLPAFSADVVTARAFAPLPRLLAAAAPFLHPSTISRTGGVGLFLKGRSIQRELTDSLGKWKMQFDLHPSRTDPTAQILRLRDLTEGNRQP